MSEVERRNYEEISDVKNKNRSMTVYSAHAITCAIPPTNATAAITAPTRPPLTAGMPRAPPFRAEPEPLDPFELLGLALPVAVSCPEMSEWGIRVSDGIELR